MSPRSARSWRVAGVTAATASLVAGVAAGAVAAPGGNGTITVTKNTDDGSPGTLRWAIETANAKAGPDRIKVTAAAGIIKLGSLLPTIVGPAVIEGVPSSGAVGVDGSNFTDVNVPTPTNSSVNDCPGVAPGGYGPDVRSISNPAFGVVDGADVEISGLTIQNFCIGILGLRSHDLYLHDNTLINTVGAAGIIITGDALDAAGSSTDLSYGHVVADNLFINHGDGAEFTRGTRDSVFRGNTFVTYDDAPAGVKGAAAVEFATAGTGNSMIDNIVLGGFGNGFQLGSSGGLFEGNVIKGNEVGITMGGTGRNVFRGNTVTGNSEVGMRVNAASTITRNSIFDNEGLGIDLPGTGVTPNDALDASLPQNFPVLSAVFSGADNRIVSGGLNSSPNGTFTVELFASESADPSGYGEGQRYVGTATVTTNAAGQGSFSLIVPATALGGISTPVFSATATNATGSTSEFGPAVQG